MQSAMLGASGADSKRGVKRQADESNLSDDLRFAKRFNLLNLSISNGGHAQQALIASGNNDHGNSYAYIPLQASTDDSMNVDDTKDRVYIGNLDAEIADIEEHEPQDRLVFLPDIERHFSRIPHHVLVGDKQGVNPEQQVVLYTVPKSLTVDENHDSVRKAIIEARHRAQDKAADAARQQEMNWKYSPAEESTETAHGYTDGYAAEHDEDAMDIA